MTFDRQTSSRQSRPGSARRQPDNQPIASDVTAQTPRTMTVRVVRSRLPGLALSVGCERPARAVEMTKASASLAGADARMRGKAQARLPHGNALRVLAGGRRVS
jgi:hypothetical protein